MSKFTCLVLCVVAVSLSGVHINDKGEYDADKALEKLKKFVSNEDDYAKFAEIGKKCASVNEKSVSDGEAGCERAALLTSCFLEHKSEVTFLLARKQPPKNVVEHQRSGPRALARLLEAAHGLKQARASVQRLSLLGDLSPFSKLDRP
ncbi:hypothetical protein HF086_010664 [Spodoptera exigua]|uniref:Uncharacterized protein n=1 Tax=Spodoptera exigua TaxID=7107 RepID=A0A922MI04_SPOEX|nr:hypothetical protein HF086_010664 [Spodoptera exigua]